MYCFEFRFMFHFIWLSEKLDAVCGKGKLSLLTFPGAEKGKSGLKRWPFTLIMSLQSGCSLFMNYLAFVGFGFKVYLGWNLSKAEVFNKVLKSHTVLWLQKPDLAGSWLLLSSRALLLLNPHPLAWDSECGFRREGLLGPFCVTVGCSWQQFQQ
jgi:hypothetical protein